MGRKPSVAHPMLRATSQFQQHDQRRIAGTAPSLCVTLETAHAGSIMARPQSPLMAKFTAEFQLII